ncbi:uncharacterized protein GLRG_02188 [Colletotrichum graminicola M1.001]|uniref:Uncharacterized protein n=1 Tax=Colletotrichum graminicola (strain M1.001 / M2 / FGSC 10212) TaxID=645133 RepID=E3Q805_COLGM|nr:uncharacterized protein GLRG_02188 [Colletotrichum graminicola M1.001]EFQ27017.1 hypothetical protein GLRG_02188 [Colletotrichum graminicola M1.001]
MLVCAPCSSTHHAEHLVPRGPAGHKWRPTERREECKCFRSIGYQEMAPRESTYPYPAMQIRCLEPSCKGDVYACSFENILPVQGRF